MISLKKVICILSKHSCNSHTQNFLSNGLQYQTKKAQAKKPTVSLKECSGCSFAP
jgi:hypothetical protein